MSKELEALNKIQHDFGQLKGQELVSCYETIFNALQRLEAIDNTFADSHICEIQKEFTKYNKLCEEGKCDFCALSVGDGICLRKVFERKWELQKEVVSPNSINLLMQELDCKDFETLRKYARCGYERLNNFKGSKKVKIEIPESSLMDYNPVKNYLKWEDLEFSKEYDTSFKVKLGDSIYTITCSTQKFNNNTKYVAIETGLITYFIEELNKQFFNDLHLERVEK